MGRTDDGHSQHTISIMTIESDINLLKKLNKTQLYQMCLDNKVILIKSANKQVYLDTILQYQKTKKEERMKVVTVNRYHRGYVEYSIPTMSIVKIFRYYWIRCTLFGDYRSALNICRVNKQFFNIVSEWFTKVTNICYTDINRVLNTWSPIKTLEDLTIDHVNFNEMMKTGGNPERTQLCQNIKKLTLYIKKGKKMYEMTGGTIKNTVFLMSNLESLYLLDFNHTRHEYKMDILGSIKTLKKIVLTGKYCPTGILYNINSPVETILIENFRIDSVFPFRNRDFHRSIKHIGTINRDYSYNLDDALNIMELTGLVKININTLSMSDNLAKLISNQIKHLIIQDILSWIDFINKMNVIEIVEDTNLQNIKNSQPISNSIKELVSPTLSTIILRFHLNNSIEEVSNFINSPKCEYSHYRIKNFHSSRYRRSYYKLNE